MLFVHKRTWKPSSKERWTKASLASSTEVQGWISGPGGSVIQSAVVQLWYRFTRATLDLELPSTSPLLKSCFINIYLFKQQKIHPTQLLLLL